MNSLCRFVLKKFNDEKKHSKFPGKITEGISDSMFLQRTISQYIFHIVNWHYHHHNISQLIQACPPLIAGFAPKLSVFVEKVITLVYIKVGSFFSLKPVPLQTSTLKNSVFKMK